jgi:SAM-dependent methyltransferase
MAEWFEEWFSSEEYLSVYKHRDDADALTLANLIFKNLDLKSNSSVLDLACGAGRHSIIFAEKGYEVTGIDLSDNLLSIGKEKSVQLGLNIDFIKGDLRDFSIDKKFNIVINLFTSFGYFDSDELNFNIFRIAFNQLQDNGYFVFDYFNSVYVEKNLNKYSVDSYIDYQITQSRSIIEDRVVKEIMIKRGGKEKKFFESVKLYKMETILEELKKTGFRIENTFGDISGEAFDEISSPRLIIIAKK